MESGRLTLAAVGIAAAVLQLLLAPALVIGDAAPNFIVAATVVTVVLFPEERHYAFAFVMGLAADLLGAGPVGATSFCLLACAYALPLAVEAVGNDNVLMLLLIFLAGLLGFELAYGVFLAGAGLVGLGAALVRVALPCTVYNALLAFVIYLVAYRFAGARPRRASGATMSNVRFN